ncbi:MAG: NAD-dependent epimerase/dehydratase family protein [Gammaproteobacteria bacterium]|nr:NAD-dependent epimerase/dehydratase family protein [Gammaproteobacteria bacterium]
MKALVIGGTGPTGPFIVNGLTARGYTTCILNRGAHDTDAIPKEVERIVADPHFPDTLEAALKGRKFDLVVATYGRIRYVAQVTSTLTDRFISIGGPPSYRGMLAPETALPRGMPVPTPEHAPRVESEAQGRFGLLVRQTEDAVMALHDEGRFSATHYRYPVVYGPRQLRANLWPIVQRVLDGRQFITLPDGGLSLVTRGYSENMGHAVLLAVDNPSAAAGQIYNCGDELQLTLRQLVQYVAHVMDAELEVISVPDRFAHASRDFIPFDSTSDHQLLDLTKIQKELNYRDVVPALEAIRDTVRWYIAHPPEDVQSIKEELVTLYDIEDRLKSINDDANAKMAQIPYERGTYHHSYAHPRERGLQKDHLNR